MTVNGVHNRQKKTDRPVIRIPPQNLDAEMSCLGCQILDSSKIAVVRGIISANDYQSDLHQLIQRGIIRLADSGSPVDEVTLAAQLERDGALGDIGGIGKLLEIMASVPDGAHAWQYASLIADCSRRRKAIAVGERLINHAFDPTKSEPEMMSAAIEAATKLGECLPLGDKSTTVPHAKILRMSDVESTNLEWIWPGRIPLGKISLFAGDPGLGKSFITVDISARISRGAVWPDDSSIESPPGSVMMFNSEDDVADTIRPRLNAAGADCDKVFFIQHIESVDTRTKEKKFRPFSLELDLPFLEQWLKDTPDARLITIDPISAYCGSTDSHKNAEVRAMLAPLAALAAKYGVAIVCVTHLSKGSGGKAVYRAMGSLAFAAAARAVWQICRDIDDENRRLMLPAKMNLCPEPNGMAYKIVDGCIHWEASPVEMTADDFLQREAAQATESQSSKSVRNEAAEWLRQALADGEKPAKELLEDAKENGHTEKTIRRAFKEMGGKPRKSGFSKGWVWSLTDHIEDGQPTVEDSEDSPFQKDGILEIFGESSPESNQETNGLFA